MQTKFEVKHNPEELQVVVECHLLKPRDNNAPISLRYAIFPSAALGKEEAQFKLKNVNDECLPEGIYSWVQINEDMGIKIGLREYLTCPKGTILAYKKDDGGSAHFAFLTKYLLNGCDSYVQSAGIFAVTADGKISEWNLRSGHYQEPLELWKPESKNEVGLPLTTYDRRGERRRSSVDATDDMRVRALSKSSASSPSSSPSITSTASPSTPTTPIRLRFNSLASTPSTPVSTSVSTPSSPSTPFRLPPSPHFFDQALPGSLTNAELSTETVNKTAGTLSKSMGALE